MDTLPNEITTYILTITTPSEQFWCRRVCSLWKQLLEPVIHARALYVRRNLGDVIEDDDVLVFQRAFPEDLLRTITTSVDPRRHRLVTGYLLSLGSELETVSWELLVYLYRRICKYGRALYTRYQNLIRLLEPAYGECLAGAILSGDLSFAKAWIRNTDHIEKRKLRHLSEKSEDPEMIQYFTGYQGGVASNERGTREIRHENWSHILAGGEFSKRSDFRRDYVHKKILRAKRWDLLAKHNEYYECNDDLMAILVHGSPLEFVKEMLDVYDESNKQLAFWSICQLGLFEIAQYVTRDGGWNVSLPLTLRYLDPRITALF